MAQGRGDINQRISVTGDDEVLRALRAIGTEGDKAFQKVDQSTQSANQSLTAFGRTSQTIAQGFRTAQAAVAPVGQSFDSLSTHAKTFGTEISNVANNIFPHFKEVVALGSIASVAGLLALTRAAVDSAHELELNARQLGISEEQFKAYSRAALQAGVDSDTFTAAATRFNITLQKFSEDTTSGILKALQAAVGPQAINGVTVLGQKATEASSRLVSGIGENIQVAQKAANIAWAQMGEDARKAFGSIGAVAQTFSAALDKGGDAAAKIREEFAKLGLQTNAKTIFEALDRQMPGFQNALLKVGLTLDDLVGPNGKVRTFSEVFPKFLDAFAKKDPIEQSRIALELFSRQGLSLLPFLQQGSKILKDFPDAFKSIGVEATAGASKVDELHTAFLTLDLATRTVRKTIGLAFAGVFQPVIDNLSKSILDNKQALQDWATYIAEAVKPIVVDFFAVLKDRNAEVQTPWVKDFVNGMREFVVSLGAAIPSVVSFFGFLRQVLDGIATVINTVFGTQLNGTALLIIGVLGTMSGAFVAIGAAVAVFGAAIAAIDVVISLLVTGPIAALIAAFGPTGLLIAGIAAATIALIAFIGPWNLLDGAITAVTTTAQFLWDGLKAIGNWIASIFMDALTALALFLTGDLSGAFKALGSAVATLFQPIQFLIDLLNKVIDLAGKAMGASGSAAGGDGGPTTALPFASGGMVPGSGYGDRVRAMLEPGEFVMRRSVVAALGADFFAGLNGGIGSLMPNRTRYATGGMVAAAAGGSAVHLHLDGREYITRTDANTAASLERAARRAQMRSGGTKPSWVS